MEITHKSQIWDGLPVAFGEFRMEDAFWMGFSILFKQETCKWYVLMISNCKRVGFVGSELVKSNMLCKPK